ncbi:MAG: CBS domain-containing protein [Thermoleophilaceae bacterium]
MSPRRMTESLVREAPLLRDGDGVGVAVETLLAGGLPALPVVDAQDRLVGLFGEREFVSALFPAYLRELKYAGFVRKALDDALEKRASCRGEPVSAHMNTEHVDVGTDFSDAQVAETFLHHRVLILPVTEDRRVRGIITRQDFFQSLAERFLER